MTHFLEQFLCWVATETLLSGILFLNYYFLIRRLRNPIDRFNFLSISFVALLFLPWVPTPAISEPFFRNLISDVTTSLQNTGAFGHGDWISHLLSLLVLAVLPFTYFSVLTIRSIRIFNSLCRVNKITRSANENDSLSEFPVIIHGYDLPPMTIGVNKPKILISRTTYQSLSQSELDLVLQHEEEHIRRGDGLSNFLRILVREILFFSPFIWILAQKLEEEMEISVDAALIFRSSHSARAYGTLLLRMADLCQLSKNVSVLGTFLSHSAIKRRLLSMKHITYGRSKFLNGLALGVFMLLGTLGSSLFGAHAYSYSNRLEFYLVKTTDIGEPHGKPILGEYDFTSASVSDCEKMCVLSLHLTPSAQKVFSELTAEHIGKKIAIAVDGKVISSPVIKSAITGQDLQITADLSKQEAQKIVERIERNIR
jgi:beta-lactamase regulating signal transducer with metallopeptidase domain